jgi:uncharacterized protein (DUF433 family)
MVNNAQLFIYLTVMVDIWYIINMTQTDINNYITVDQEVAHGKPVFKGTRIMLYLVLEMLAAGETINDVLEAYPQLSKEAVKAALGFAAHTLQIGERYIEFPKLHGLKTAY